MSCQREGCQAGARFQIRGHKVCALHCPKRFRNQYHTLSTPVKSSSKHTGIETPNNSFSSIDEADFENISGIGTNSDPATSVCRAQIFGTLDNEASPIDFEPPDTASARLDCSKDLPRDDQKEQTQIAPTPIKHEVPTDSHSIPIEISNSARRNVAHESNIIYKICLLSVILLLIYLLTRR